MKLVFSKSTLPLSVLIRWGLNEPVSHFAIVFQPDNLLFQSNLLGAVLDYYPRFLDAATIVYSIDVPMDQDVENKIYMSAMDNFAGHGYGYTSFLYFTWRAFLFKCFKIPWPPKNVFNEAGDYLCVGLAQALDCDGSPTWLREVVKGIPDLEIISPYNLYERILKAQGEASAVI